jgi:hypothetical protein
MSNFNDSSIGSLIIEINAAVLDVLSFHTDRMFQETQIDYAQERKSIMAMARTFGLKIPGKRPSISVVDFSVVLPVNGSSFDVTYAPVIRQGAQVSGGGKIFETTDDIDFSSPFTIGGLPNRIIIPNIDNNGNIQNYTITKREIVINGITKIFKRTLNEADVRPFFELILPDNDVLSIESIITLEGTNYVANPTLDQFLDINYKWFEVDALAEDKVFIVDTTSSTDNAGIKPGKFLKIDKRFIREYTDLGFTKLTFGGGSQDISSLANFNVNPSLIERVGDFINNLSLGITPTANQTLFVQYRTGGGSTTNLGTNIIKTINIADVIINGSDAVTNASVKRSLSVNNPIPALGGRDEPSVDEIRNLVKYNFSAQNRAVTINDYQSRVSLMPGSFGVPFRCGVFEEQNKIKISILGLDANANLTNSSTNTLRNNISEYLSDFRMLNDYVEVDNGRIVNIGFEVDLFIQKDYPQSQITTQVINDIANYIDKNNFQMGENIYLGQLYEIINNVAGVLNVIEIRVYNKVGGGQYSLNEIAQPYIDQATRQIDLLGQFTLFGSPDTMFECKNTAKDILVRVKS